LNGTHPAFLQLPTGKIATVVFNSQSNAHTGTLPSVK
jgi:hypothetical protein